MEPNTQQVSQFASDVIGLQQPAEQKQPKTSPAVAAVYPVAPYIPAVASAFHSANVNQSTAVPVTTTLSPSSTSVSAVTTTPAGKLPTVVVPSPVNVVSMASYTKPYVSVPRRAFAQPTFLVRNGHKVQCVMMPPKNITTSALIQQSVDDETNTLRVSSPPVTQI